MSLLASAATNPVLPSRPQRDRLGRFPWLRLRAEEDAGVAQNCILPYRGFSIRCGVCNSKRGVDVLALWGSTPGNQRWLGRPKRWQPKPAFESQIDPIHQSSLKVGQCFLVCRSCCDQPSKARDSGAITLICSEKSDLSEFQRLLTVCV